MRLTLEQKAELDEAIRVWADQADRLPEGVAELGEELRHDLHDAESRREGG